MSVIDSHNNIMYSSSTYGMMTRFVQMNMLATTSGGTTGSGYNYVQRYPNTINIFGGTTASPSLGSGVLGGYMTQCDMMNEDQTVMICALEYNMGNISGSTDVFTDGVAMPTKNVRIEGTTTAIQTATMIPMAVVTTTFAAAGTYTYDITYVNQAGTGGRTATLVIPTLSAVNSAFEILPHLQSGDTGIQDITNITLTAGNPSAGQLTIMGLLPLGMSIAGPSLQTAVFDPLNTVMPMYLIENTDVMAFYRFLSISGTTNNLYACLSIVAEY